MSILIDLYHGRLDPNEDMKDFGFFGPVLGPFPQFQMTNKNIFHLGGKDLVLADWDKDNDLFPFLGSYYGDVSIISKSEIKKSETLQKRIELTKMIFKIPFKDLYKYCADSEPWVKQYVKYQLRGANDK
jgi:hypothetical protein